ncbi:MAG: rhamnulokinase, partial [Candidatus Aminicenantes bacterium]|nr:rhamnulokinase [Candidatus Aminicenantes bacterium]
MGARRLLAIDLGAESGRAVLGTLEGGRLKTTAVHRFPNVPVLLFGHWHWDVFRLFDEVKTALARTAAEVQGGVDSVAVDTWGVDFGLLARDGSLLGLPFCYRDARTEGALGEFLKIVPRERVYELTGIQFLPFNTLFQVYAMVRDRSPLLDAASDLLFMPDIFSYFLSGSKASEFTMATTSQFYNPRTREWNWGFFEEVGFSKRLLQKVVPPGTVLGPLRPEVAGETGHPEVPIVATASHDTGAAVAAVPAEGTGWAYISSGTWSLIGIEVKKPIISAKALAANFTNEGGVEGTFRFLKNVTGLWLLQQCRKSWSPDLALGYDELVAGAADATPFAALVDPDAPDFLHPPDMPTALGGYWRRTGQTGPPTRAGITRSILESLALKYRLTLDELRAVTGRTIDRIHVIGGGSQNRLLCQFTAD